MRQVANRLQLLQNRREATERQFDQAPVRSGATVSSAILSPPTALPVAVIGQHIHPKVAELRQLVRNSQRLAEQARFDAAFARRDQTLGYAGSLTHLQRRMLEVTAADFTAMGQLATRCRGILRGRDVGKLDVWLRDAAQ